MMSYILFVRRKEVENARDAIDGMMHGSARVKLYTALIELMANDNY